MAMASGVWKQEVIKISTTINRNAELCADWLKTLKPNASALYILRDDQDVLSTTPNGTMYMASLFNNIPFSYIRLYDNNKNMQGLSGWASNYYLTVTENDTYTIFYQE